MRTISHERPLLTTADENLFAATLNYQDRDIDEELAIIELTRKKMARILRGLKPDAANRVGVHAFKGLVSLEALLTSAVNHISHHVPFIEEKRKGRPIVSSSAYLEFLSRWEDFSISAYHAPGVRCAAGRGFVYIDPLGKAYPCVYVKGKTTPVDLLAHGWREAWNRETPCTRCTVGPMLEFNLLFERPLSAAVESIHAYA